MAPFFFLRRLAIPSLLGDAWVWLNFSEMAPPNTPGFALHVVWGAVRRIGVALSLSMCDASHTQNAVVYGNVIKY